MFRPSTRSASTALAALFLAGMAPAGAVDRVTFGQVSPTATLWPGVVAAKKGFFVAAGVEMDVVSIGVSPGQQAVASGSLDIMHNACNAIVASAPTRSWNAMSAPTSRSAVRTLEPGNNSTASSTGYPCRFMTASKTSAKSECPKWKWSLEFVISDLLRQLPTPVAASPNA